MFQPVLPPLFDDNLLRRADRFLSSLPKSMLVVGIVAIELLLLYVSLSVGPWISLSMFYVFNLYLSVKYIGSEFAYVMAFMTAAGTTYIKIGFYLEDALWWQAHWQFISTYSMYSLFCYLINEQITGRKNAEAVLVELSELSEAIVTGTAAGVLVFDESGKCVIANQAIANMLCVPLPQLQQSDLVETGKMLPSSLMTVLDEAKHSGKQSQLTIRLEASDSARWSVVSVGQIRRATASYLLLVFTDVSAYKAAQDAAEGHLLNVSEEVQQRIGRELHDDIGQHLAGMAFMCEVLFRKLQDSGREEMHGAARITAMVNEAISKTRHLSQGLYPEELKEKGLYAMLEKLASSVETIHHITCKLECGCAHPIVDPEIVIQLFRISQEAVNNSIRHGHARQIGIRIVGDEQSNILTIEDNGCGMGNATGSYKGGGLGMRSMQYRADLIGAVFRVSGSAHGGACITVRMPLRSEKGESCSTR